MKAFIIVFFCFFNYVLVYGQQAMITRHRIGFTIASGNSFNSTKSDLWNLSRKRSMLYSYGGFYEYQYSNRLALRTGLNLEFSNFHFVDNPDDSIDLYFYYQRPNFINESPCNYEQTIIANATYPGTPPRFRQSFERLHRIGYLSIPIEVAFRTKMKNFNRFYATTGIRTGILFRSRAKDVYLYPGSEDINRQDKIIISDANRTKFNLMGGFGFERNYTGSSSVFLAIEFDLAINNTFSQRKKNATIFTANNLTEKYPIESLSGISDFSSNHLRQNQIRLKIGILF